MIEDFFASLQGTYRRGLFSVPTVYYFSIDNIQKTLTLDSEGYTIEDGRTVRQADCVCKTSYALFCKIWNEGYYPGIMNYGSQKTSASSCPLLQRFLLAFGRKGITPAAGISGRAKRGTIRFKHTAG